MNSPIIDSQKLLPLGFRVLLFDDKYQRSASQAAADFLDIPLKGVWLLQPHKRKTPERLAVDAHGRDFPLWLICATRTARGRLGEFRVKGLGLGFRV